jgi:flagellar hook assembly protein FlgD
LPTTYGLSENYPNPFNPITTIAYQVPPPGGMVSIQVYNVLGQRVATLVDEQVAPGFYTTMWTGINSRGNQVSSGMYFVQMRAQNFVQTRKLLLLK